MRRLLCPILVLSLVSSVRPRHIFSFGSRTEKSWWGWAWGAESTVSVVDRSPVISFSSRPAAFGAEITGPILGYVIPVNTFTTPCSPDHSASDLLPNTGCPRLCLSGPYEPDPSETWIALVQRGKCEFVNKVREAQRLGARAVVVGGENPNISGLPDTLVNMYSPEDASDVKIAATYIKHSDYVQLSALIAASNTSHSGLRTLSLLITADYSTWEWYSPIVTFIVILLLPSALTFMTLLIHRIRAARAAQRDRAPEDIVRNLPWQVWTGAGWEKHEGGEGLHPAQPPKSTIDLERGVVESAEQHETSTERPSTSRPPKPEVTHPWFENQQECAICLSEFAKGDKVRVLPCHHIFHLDEVDEWLIQRKKLCPVCKADVTQPPHLATRTVLTEESRTPTAPSHSRSTSPETATERTPLLMTDTNTNDTH
ncbi:hypothetical protein ARMGADRAFT_1009418 [Armillaria gallica]|uniref:RING-type E3 ubiquitin transferase n=1 Tax=Armillaria gallica TaxID=47427 RepID=A0A2H3E2N0_ARMGA|nr:hypothetical protein ARMGADRAFT_1009418 [Armillaria gallica]